MRVFVFVILWPLTEASASCAKSASLLSLRADMSKNEEGVAESNGSNATNGTSCQNCSMSNSSNHTLNPKLEELVKNVLQNDMNESADMPDPVGDASGGSLGQNLEFLYLKVVSWHKGLFVPKHQTMFPKHVRHYRILQGPRQMEHHMCHGQNMPKHCYIPSRSWLWIHCAYYITSVFLVKFVYRVFQYEIDDRTVYLLCFDHGTKEVVLFLKTCFPISSVLFRWHLLRKAHLETAVELQGIEFRFAKQER